MGLNRKKKLLFQETLKLKISTVVFFVLFSIKYSVKNYFDITGLCLCMINKLQLGNKGM